MKAILVLALALVGFGSAAQATSLHPDTFAKISKVTSAKMDSQLRTGIRAGTVKYNTVKGTVEIVLTRNGTCGFVSCDNLNWEISLPIVKHNATGCGYKVYASEAKLSTNGLVESVEITDFANMGGGIGPVCMIDIPPGQEVRVVYKSKYFDNTTGKTVSTTSTIYATPVQGY
ncbi:MAG TPA: hypothetical protein VFV50_07290 [Bdellovibrionales bacterium]|nr:hypothetical protein [Bdellovibrionales bacterium]